MALKLQRAGFARVSALAGGFDSWLDGGHATEPAL
jgi:rhodanese-related sulfurtransferase